MKFPGVLAVIPARGGSKGIPGKNIKELAGKKLIAYTIDYVRSLFDDDDICLSTDSSSIIQVAKECGLPVPFVRPDELATDSAGTFEVIQHALQFYQNAGKTYEAVALFQPTSPFRLKSHFKEAISIYNNDIDMVVSVITTKSNPYYLLMEENQQGFLEKSKQAEFTARQQLPPVYEINGSIYIYNAKALDSYSSFSQFKKIRKYLMDDIYSVDIDTNLDWQYAEFLLQNGLIRFD